MSNVIINDSHLTNIASAIRGKNGTSTKYKPGEMAEAINGITASEDLSSELTTQNTLLTTQEATIEDIVLALQNKTAGSGGEIVLQEKTITPTTSQQNVVADSSYNGLSKVVVNAVTSSIDSDIKATNIKKGVNILGVTGTLEEGITPTGTKEITANGTYDVTNYASAFVNVPTGGGSDVATMSISVIDDSMSSFSQYSLVALATVCENGVFSTKKYNIPTGSAISIPNVVVGSGLIVIEPTETYKVSDYNMVTPVYYGGSVAVSPVTAGMTYMRFGVEEK